MRILTRSLDFILKVPYDFIMNKHIINLAIIFILSGCATKITFKTSPPGAEVMVSKGDNLTSLGKSPLTVKESDISQKLGVNLKELSYYRVKATLDGENSESVIVPVGLWGSTNTTIVIPMKNENKVANPDKVIRHVVNAQKFAENKQLLRSHDELDQALKLAPNFSYAMSMKGALYFADKDYKQSREWYTKALDKDPGNAEALVMLKELEKIK